MEITGPACSSLQSQNQVCRTKMRPRGNAAEYARPDDSDSITARSRKRPRTTGLTLKAQPAGATDTCGVGRPCPPSSSSSRSSTTTASALTPQQQGVVTGVPQTAWAPLRLVPGPRPPLHLTAPGLGDATLQPTTSHTPASKPATSGTGSSLASSPAPIRPPSPSPTSPFLLPAAAALTPATSTTSAASSRPYCPAQPTSPSPCPSPAPFPPQQQHAPGTPWQSAADLPCRLGLARAISQVLRVRCPQLPPPTRLALTRVVELALYCGAPSPPAYLDKGSLQLRVLKAVQERGAAAAARRRGLQHGKAVAHGPAASEAVGRLTA
ncbi:hypothetical protein QJQ45_017720 [Haematococcus lacustris]|nr:hypothetical protein QJQ45_017720 [Haematococcus lacustris]